MFKILSFGLDAGFESFPPLVNGLVHNRLFQVSPDLNCHLLLLSWKPCSWYSAHTKLFKHNESATEWQCTVWKIVVGELILINLCRPALGVHFLWNTAYKQHQDQLKLLSLWGKQIEHQPVWLGLRWGTRVGWQLTLCDPIWQVTLRSSEMDGY